MNFWSVDGEVYNFCATSEWYLFKKIIIVAKPVSPEHRPRLPLVEEKNESRPKHTQLVEPNMPPW